MEQKNNLFTLSRHENLKLTIVKSHKQDKKSFSL